MTLLIIVNYSAQTKQGEKTALTMETYNIDQGMLVYVHVALTEW